MAETKPKPKLNKKAVEMAKQDPKVRAKNFNEVALGYTEAEASKKPADACSAPNPCALLGAPWKFQFQNSSNCSKRRSTAKPSH